MNRITRILLAAFAAGLCIASGVQADVRMHKLFSNEMVLQRDTAVPVYGWADAGEAVTGSGIKILTSVTEIVIANRLEV